jgi:hypothetical protein
VCTCTQKLPYEYPDHHPRCAWMDPSQLHESVLSVLRQKRTVMLHYTKKTLNLHKSCQSWCFIILMINKDISRATFFLSTISIRVCTFIMLSGSFYIFYTE